MGLAGNATRNSIPPGTGITYVLGSIRYGGVAVANWYQRVSVVTNCNSGSAIAKARRKATVDVKVRDRNRDVRRASKSTIAIHEQESRPSTRSCRTNNYGSRHHLGRGPTR